MHANPLRSKLGGEVTNGAFQRGFGNAHNIVVLHDHLTAVIGHREERATFAHQWLGEMRHTNEGPA